MSPDLSSESRCSYKQVTNIQRANYSAECEVEPELMSKYGGHTGSRRVCRNNYSVAAERQRPYRQEPELFLEYLSDTHHGRHLLTARERSYKQ